MRKEFLFIGLIACLFTTIAQAWPKPRPLGTFSLGADALQTHLNQNITIISPFQNSYDSGGFNIQPVAGLFLGAETPIQNYALAQLGLSYYQSKTFTVQGSVYQFTDPTLNNLAYHYYIQSQRVLVEGKLLTTFQTKYHPFITAGAGEAINQAYQYTEVPVSTADLPMSQGFNNKTYHSFAYELGFGLDTDITKNLRAGLAYRFVELGEAGLNKTPLQSGSQTIKYDHLRLNELVLQVTLLG